MSEGNLDIKNEKVRDAGVNSNTKFEHYGDL